MIHIYLGAFQRAPLKKFTEMQLIGVSDVFVYSFSLQGLNMAVPPQACIGSTCIGSTFITCKGLQKYEIENVGGSIGLAKECQGCHGSC